METTADHNRNSSDVHDICMWGYEDFRGSLRSCFDCLNVPLKDQNCGIDPQGVCVSMNGSAIDADNSYYEAYRFRYCPSDDSICRDCKQNWTREYATNATIRSTNVCTGAGGCICVAACEIFDTSRAIFSQKNKSSYSIQTRLGAADDSAAVGHEVVTTLIIVAICITAFVVFLWRVRIWVKRRGWTGNPSQPIRSKATEPQLNLSGWASMRERLMNTHQVRLTKTSEPHVPVSDFVVVVEDHPYVVADSS